MEEEGTESAMLCLQTMRRSCLPSKSTNIHFDVHRKLSNYNTSVIRDGLSTNKEMANPNSNTSTVKRHKPNSQLELFDIQKWDPELSKGAGSTPTRTSSENFFSTVRKLSPVARYICDSFRKHKNWGAPIIGDLNKLRRVTPNLVTEVLKVQSNTVLASKFFHWAGKQKGYRHNYSSYNAFAYCLNRNKQFRSADQVPELMLRQGKPPTEKQFEILVRMHSDANRGLRVHYVYQKMKKFGVKPRVFLYNRIMDALVKTGHMDLSMSVYNAFCADGLIEENVTFMILIKGFCKTGQIEEVLTLLDRMRGNSLKPDIFAYTAMVKILVSEGHLDGCLVIWEEMRKDNILPDVMAYTTLVRGLCSGNKVEKAYELFKQMKENRFLIDRAVYGSLIEAFVENGRVSMACDLLEDLIKSGYRPDIPIYNSIIKGMCSANQVDKACRIFQAVIGENLTPEFETVNPILVSYVELQRVDDFWDLVQRIHRLGLTIDEVLPRFLTLVVDCGRKIATAVTVFEKLKKEKYYSTSVYNILMQSMHRTGETDRALLLFDEMQFLSIKPNDDTYNILIKCLVNVGKLEKACDCYKKIKMISCVPSVSAYLSLANGLCRIGEIDAAMILVRDCLANVTSGPIEFKYSLAILDACKGGEAQSVIDLVDEMMDEGCIPNEVVYSTIICGVCKRGTLDDARKIFSHMQEKGLLTEAQMIGYEEMLIEHTKKKTADLIKAGLKFFGLESKLKAKGFKLLDTPQT